VRVNQERAASTFTASSTQWQNLGTFSVTGNSLTVRVTSDAEGRVIADAVRLERVYASIGGTLVNRGALPAVADFEFEAAEPSGIGERPAGIDDVIFAPAEEPGWRAVQQHLDFLRPEARPFEFAPLEMDDQASAALLQSLAEELNSLAVNR